MIYNSGIQRVISTKSVKPALQLAYVKLMMDVIGRGLVMASQVDEEIKTGSCKIPQQLCVVYESFSEWSSLCCQSHCRSSIRTVTEYGTKTRFNHYLQTLKSCIFSVFIQESTAQAFAHDRMIADGDVSYAIRLVRCLK